VKEHLSHFVEEHEGALPLATPLARAEDRVEAYHIRGHPFVAHVLEHAQGGGPLPARRARGQGCVVRDHVSGEALRENKEERCWCQRGR